MQPWQQMLLGLILDDRTTVSMVLAADGRVEHLDDRTDVLVKIAAACASVASRATFERLVTDALDAGASEEDVVQVLVTCAPIIGGSRLVRAAPSIAAGLGFNPDDPLESLNSN